MSTARTGRPPMPGSLYFFALLLGARLRCLRRALLAGRRPALHARQVLRARLGGGLVLGVVAHGLYPQSFVRPRVRSGDCRSQTVIVRIYLERAKCAAMRGSMKASMTAIRPPSMLRTCTPRACSLPSCPTTDRTAAG